MTSAITGSIILFTVFYLNSGVTLTSVAFSCGPISFFFLLSKREIEENDLEIRAGDWIQRVIMGTVIGIIYTSGVILIVSIIPFMFSIDWMMNKYFFILIIIAHFFLPAYKHSKYIFQKSNSD